MAKFAAGKYALGVSDRSGFVYKLNDMRLEWTGSLVGPEEWEKKQPQLDPKPVGSDPQALWNPRPQRSSTAVLILLEPVNRASYFSRRVQK